MPQTKYTYSIATDTANGTYDGKLSDEISSSAIVIALDYISTDADVLDIYMKDALSTGDEAILLSTVNAHDGVAPPDGINTVDIAGKSAIQNAIPVVSMKPEETSFSRATHDFCNKCTWYTMSAQVTGEAPTPSGLTYNLANDFIIDVRNGVVNRQDTLLAYDLIAYDGGVEIDKSGYTIDHRNGSVTLLSAPSGAVTFDYSYATTSDWKVSPDAGKMLIIEHSEVQFSTDVVMGSPMTFTVWIDNPYLGIPGHPYELGPARLPAETVQYNSIRDIVNESNLGYQVPTMIGIGQPIVVFPFNYVTVKPLYGYLNAELVIRSVDDSEMTGTYGTATFYLISRDDVV